VCGVSSCGVVVVCGVLLWGTPPPVVSSYLLSFPSPLIPGPYMGSLYEVLLYGVLLYEVLLYEVVYGVAPLL